MKHVPTTIVVLLLLSLPPAHGRWGAFNPPGSTVGGGILADVLSHCDEQGRQTAYDQSPVTYCHEATHQVNARIRNQSGGAGINCFYVGGGRYCLLPEPRVTLATAAQYVRQHRNGTFQLYFIDQQRDWNNQPLSIFDEWSAYINGSQHARESRADEHGSDERCQWFNHYADAVVEATRRHDPSYSAMAELDEFVAYQKARVSSLLGGGNSWPPTSTLVYRPTVPVPVTPVSTDHEIMDLPPQMRELNTDGSCVHISTANLMRWLNMPDRASAYRSQFSRGEVPSRHKEKLDRFGIRYAMTDDGDEQLLEYAISSRRGAGVTWGTDHFINLVGRVNGEAVLMGNGQSGISYYHRQPWAEFLAEWHRCGGWTVVILDGFPPPAIPY